jgi:3-hydroxyisobutyrate dehydrogenase-like beta-hydroxyacid dehydrogenase
MNLNICLLGFGEAGQILGTDIAARGLSVCAWDVQFPRASSAPSQAIAQAIARCSRIRVASNAQDAVQAANVVLCAVTAEQTLAAARTVATNLAPDSYFVDLNSASPGVKEQAARVIHAGHGRYVEAAVMAALPSKRMAVPIYLGGPHADSFSSVAETLGFTGAVVFADQIGPASAAKMCRSIIIKGMEALLLESMLTARHYSVDEFVLDSLSDLLPAADWRALSHYMISRAVQHGRRRAEEMQEVCRTVKATQLVPIMSSAVAQRQAWAAEHGLVANHESLHQLLDALRQRIAGKQAQS